MATELKTIVVRRRVPDVPLAWFDGQNGVEVARWLIDHGKAQVDVHFKSGETTLSIGGYSKNVPDGEDGVWIDPVGNLRRVGEVHDQFDVVDG